MAKKRNDWSMDYKLWTPRMTLEGKGNIKACISMLFGFMPPDMRESLLARLTAEHIDQTEKENAATRNS